MPASPSSSPGSASEPVIRLTGVATRIGGRVLQRNIDLELRPGEVLGVVGASGVGQIGAAQDHRRADARRCRARSRSSAAIWPRIGCRRARAARRTLGRAVPGRRAVQLAHRRREHRRAAQGAARPAAGAAATRFARSSWRSSGCRPRRGDKYPSRAVGRDAQARGARPRAGARSAAPLPRRADRRPRPDRRGRVRPAGARPQGEPRPHRVHGDARPRQPDRHRRPHRGAHRQPAQDRHNGRHAE